jgi:hypothetical protein
MNPDFLKEQLDKFLSDNLITVNMYKEFNAWIKVRSERLNSPIKMMVLKPLNSLTKNRTLYIKYKTESPEWMYRTILFDTDMYQRIDETHPHQRNEIIILFIPSV